MAATALALCALFAGGCGGGNKLDISEEPTVCDLYDTAKACHEYSGSLYRSNREGGRSACTGTYYPSAPSCAELHVGVSPVASCSGNLGDSTTQATTWYYPGFANCADEKSGCEMFGFTWSGGC